MKNLNHHVEICKGKLDRAGIRYGVILSVTPNSRAKKRWGSVRPSKHPIDQSRGGYEISINTRLLQDDVSDSALEETILHELIHTCPGCMNHGPNWQSVAAKVNRIYGYHISRTTSSKDKGIPDYDHELEYRYKYALVCKKCGNETRYNRMSKTVRDYKNYRCGACGGELSFGNLDEIKEVCNNEVYEQAR